MPGAPGPVLHLIEPHRLGPCGPHIVRAALGQEGRERSDIVVVLGGAPARDACRDAGLPFDHRIAPPLREAALAWRQLRMLAARRTSPARMIAWSAGALAAARLAAPDIPTSVILCEPPGARWPFRMIERRAVAGHTGPVCALDESVRTSWGVPAAAVVEPALPSDGLIGRWRTAQRRWGADGAIVIGFAAPEGGRIDGYAASKVVGALGLCGVRAVAVMPEDAAGLERAARLHERLDRLWTLHFERGPSIEWLPACDVVVEETPGSLAGRLASRAGALVVPAEPRRRGAVSAGNIHAHSGAGRIIAHQRAHGGAMSQDRRAPWQDEQVRTWRDAVRAVSAPVAV